jgi:hypothetical protein
MKPKMNEETAPNAIATDQTGPDSGLCLKNSWLRSANFIF